MCGIITYGVIKVHRWVRSLPTGMIITLLMLGNNNKLINYMVKMNHEMNNNNKNKINQGETGMNALPNDSACTHYS